MRKIGYHRHVALVILKKPKAYFYDSGFVKGDEWILVENTCAVGLSKHEQDVSGISIRSAGLT